MNERHAGVERRERVAVDVAIRPVLLRIESGEEAHDRRIGPRRDGSHVADDDPALGEAVHGHEPAIGDVLAKLIDEDADDARRAFTPQAAVQRNGRGDRVAQELAPSELNRGHARYVDHLPVHFH